MKIFDNIYEKYNDIKYISTDPIEFCYSYSNKSDQELIGFISALFSYGNINSIKAFLRKLFNYLGKNPIKFLLDEYTDLPPDLYYRFQTNQDIHLFLQTLKSIYLKSNTLEKFFYPENKPTRERIMNFQKFYLNESLKFSKNNKFSPGYKFLIGSANKDSSNKRYNMFLRWMVRDTFPDLNIYTSFLKSDLLYPLDTHILKISKILSLTLRNTPGYKMSAEITNEFKKFNKNDPLKYDFPLSRLGILKECKVSYEKTICESCLLKSNCSIYALPR